MFREYFNYQSPSLLVKDLYEDNQNKNDIIVKYLNESLIEENPIISQYVIKLRLPFRSSCSQMFFIVGVFKIFAIFVEKHLCWSLFLIKFAGLNLQRFYKETPTKVFSFEY